MEKISFIASLSPIQSAIKISGDGNGARVQLEIPQSELASIIKLQLLTNKAFRVIIEPGEENGYR
jgi:hypothetical protein